MGYGIPHDVEPCDSVFSDKDSSALLDDVSDPEGVPDDDDDDESPSETFSIVTMFFFSLQMDFELVAVTSYLALVASEVEEQLMDDFASFVPFKEFSLTDNPCMLSDVDLDIPVPVLVFVFVSPLLHVVTDA